MYRYLYRAEFPLHGLLHLATLIILYPPLLLICVVVACDHRSTSALVALLHGHRPYVLHCIMLLVFFQSTACVVMLTANHRSTSGDNMCCKTSCYHFSSAACMANRKLDNILRFVNLQLFREWECRHRHKDRELCADSDCCRHTDCVLSNVCGMTSDISMHTFADIYQTVLYSSFQFLLCCATLQSGVTSGQGDAQLAWSH